MGPFTGINGQICHQSYAEKKRKNEGGNEEEEGRKRKIGGSGREEEKESKNQRMNDDEKKKKKTLMIKIDISEESIIKEQAEDELEGGVCPWKPKGQKRNRINASPEPKRLDSAF